MPVNDNFLNQIITIVGDTGCITDSKDLEAYNHDEFALKTYTSTPKVVVKPDSEKQVAQIVSLCSDANVPVTTRGGGTGLSAACVPSPDGIVLSMERLNNVIEANAGDYSITVQAGVTLEQLMKEAEKIGYFFPPHPGDEGAMAGGLVATNAGGARAVKYGTVKRFVLGLEVVLANGEIIELGGNFIKSSTGYNLLDLMVGSEGTLGIITRVTFALLPSPGTIQTLIAPFATMEEAIESVPAILAKGIVPFAVEFVEHSAIRCSEQLLNLTWPARTGAASLMVILDGSDEETVLASAQKIMEVLEEHGALDVLLAERKSRQEEILKIRSMIYEALRPGTVELFDICVPRSQISGHVRFIHGLEEKYQVPLPTYGHAADGNVHTNFMRTKIKDGLLGEEIPEWEKKYELVRTEIFDDAIRRKGIISGEHGIGLAKRDYLARNIGEINVNVMRSIKKALDPKGILNPGKIFAM